MAMSGYAAGWLSLGLFRPVLLPARRSAAPLRGDVMEADFS